MNVEGLLYKNYQDVIMKLNFITEKRYFIHLHLYKPNGFLQAELMRLSNPWDFDSMGKYFVYCRNHNVYVITEVARLDDKETFISKLLQRRVHYIEYKAGVKSWDKVNENTADELIKFYEEHYQDILMHSSYRILKVREEQCGELDTVNAIMLNQLKKRFERYENTIR